MKITQLKQQVKNPERVSIFVEGKYSFSLTLDQLLQQKLKKDTELNDAQLKSLKKLSEEGKIRARTLEWVLRRPHSTRELREYLYKKKVEKDFMEQIISEMSKKGYINDDSFATWFAENRLRKHKSKREITAELSSKGINKEISERVLKELLPDDESEQIKALVAKLSKRSRYQDEKKLIEYLQRKGFRYADIKEVIEMM